MIGRCGRAYQETTYQPLRLSQGTTQKRTSLAGPRREDAVMGEPWLMLSARGASAAPGRAEHPGEDRHAPSRFQSAFKEKARSEQRKWGGRYQMAAVTCAFPPDPHSGCHMLGGGCN